MKILFFTTGPEQVASSRTRVYQYLPHLRERGIEAKVINHISAGRSAKNLNLARPSFFERVADRIFSWFQTLKVLIIAGNYDIVFIQKVLLPVPVINMLSAINGNVVFDFDDAMYLADRFNDESNRSVFLDRFKRTIEISKCVIVENEQNRRYAERLNPNVEIITGPIDTSRYVPAGVRKKDASVGEKVVIGWIGSPEATKYIESLKSVFKALAERHKNLVLSLVGSSDFSLDGVMVTTKKWSLRSEVRDLQGFDIGIMPLEDDEWSRGKGGYKLLQYMATGIPCVASPVGVNKEIIKDGINGYLAATEQEWLEKLSMLIKDISLRNKLGCRGRSIAEEDYSYYSATPKFVALLNGVSK